MPNSDININIRSSVDSSAFQQQAIARAEAERIARAALRAQLRADIQRDIADISQSAPQPGDNLPSNPLMLFNAPKALSDAISPGFWDEQAKKLSLAISEGADAISRKFQQLTGFSGTPIVDSLSLKPSAYVAQQLQELNAKLQTLADAESQDSAPITHYSQVPQHIIDELSDELSRPPRTYSSFPDYDRRKMDYDRMVGSATSRQLNRRFSPREIELFQQHNRLIDENPGVDPHSLSPFAQPPGDIPDRDTYHEQRAEYESMLSSGYTPDELSKIFGQSLIDMFETDAASSAPDYEEKRADYESMRSAGYTPEELSKLFSPALIRSFERDASPHSSDSNAVKQPASSSPDSSVSQPVNVNNDFSQLLSLCQHNPHIIPQLRSFLEGGSASFSSSDSKSIAPLLHSLVPFSQAQLSQLSAVNPQAWQAPLSQLAESGASSSEAQISFSQRALSLFSELNSTNQQLTSCLSSMNSRLSSLRAENAKLRSNLDSITRSSIC